jgi:hypothetical protein
MDGPAKAAMADYKAPGTHILLIGDSDDLPVLYGKLLHPRYTIHKAGTAQGAIRLLRQSGLNVQLVLLDLVAPPPAREAEDGRRAGMSSTALLAFLRHEYPAMQILLLWGHSRSDLQQCGFGHLAHTFPLLYKSGSRRAVLTAVEDVLLRPALTYEPIRGWELCAQQDNLHAGGGVTADRPAAHKLTTRYQAAEASATQAPCTLASRLALFLLHLFQGFS